MAANEKRLIVIRKVKKPGGHHGGTWKIAYADFVTAMMAFFLLMWLLGSATEEQLQGVSAYFQTPVKSPLENARGTGDRTSVIQGGGKDITMSAGQVRKVNGEKGKRNLKAAQAELDRMDKLKLEDLKTRLEQLIAERAS